MPLYAVAMFDAVGKDCQMAFLDARDASAAIAQFRISNPLTSGCVSAMKVPEQGCCKTTFVELPTDFDTTNVQVSSRFMTKSMGTLAKIDSPRDIPNTSEGVALFNQFLAGLTIAQRAWQSLPLEVPAPASSQDGTTDSPKAD